ncbi:MAG TPA: hypothetical protein VFO93_20685 [Hymenobacter sp.]|uniref:hypothetical protein n=1 Tax=Hymenobacter sp. TaxID=1898978 RepID=UPI002D7E245F|nr:hypothetical protein [Hymenobacter sp.]HET9505976.1 hypothetical protein [Hymenobacter sp.]
MTTYDIRVYGLLYGEDTSALYGNAKFQHVLDDLTFDQVKKLWVAQNPHLEVDVIAIYNTTKMHFCTYHHNYYE